MTFRSLFIKLTLAEFDSSQHLENTFYSQALQKYSEQDFTDAGFDSSVRAKVERISGDEQTHVDFLSSALQSLGQTPVEPCTCM